MKSSSAAYDVVGNYHQDEINGFDENFIRKFVEKLGLKDGMSVLDAMGGDGNLSLKILEHCEKFQIKLKSLTLLEYSKVQSEFAERNFAKYFANTSGSLISQSDVEVLCADILSLNERFGEKIVPAESFDVVVIKSANHEIPMSSQAQMYRSVAKVLKPGAKYFNLGFLWENSDERDEFREIARTKDSLANMIEAVQNRHFPTTQEFYENLARAGFVNVSPLLRFEYKINSKIVAEEYFKEEIRNVANLDFQFSQLKAFNMRRAGRIDFSGAHTTMSCPGEVTVAVKMPSNDKDSLVPSGGRVVLRNGNGAGHGSKQSISETVEIFDAYPYELVRKIKVHQQMLDSAARFVDAGQDILDVGCGIGLLAERLVGSRISTYLGIDLSRSFINHCNEKFNDQPSFEFLNGDVQKLEFTPKNFDIAFLINVLYIEGINPGSLLKTIAAALRPKGRIVVSGPLSKDSFINAEPKIRQQLAMSGATPDELSAFDKILDANRRLLSPRSNYWSAEGMLELILESGFTKALAFESSHFYDNAYLVAAEK